MTDTSTINIQSHNLQNSKYMLLIYSMYDHACVCKKIMK